MECAELHSLSVDLYWRLIDLGLAVDFHRRGCSPSRPTPYFGSNLGKVLTEIYKEMEFATRTVNTVTKFATSNAGINIFLFGAFGGLSVRSLVQQKEIDALEVEKESLAKSNKEMKKTMWDWKQKLYADAANVESAVVPLAKLKAIYGDYTAPASPTSDSTKEEVKASTPKFVI